MPTYEFACPAGHHFERFYRKISDAVGDVGCPDCGAIATRRISAGGGLIFKGSGFYITDYPKKSQSDAGKGQTDGSGSKSESSASSGDSGSSAPSTTTTSTSETSSKTKDSSTKTKNE